MDCGNRAASRRRVGRWIAPWQWLGPLDSSSSSLPWTSEASSCNAGVPPPDGRGLLLLAVRGQVVQAHAGTCRRLEDCCRSDSSITPQLVLRPREDSSAESWRVYGRCAGPPIAQQRLVLVGALAPEAELLQDRLGAREEPRRFPRREQAAVHPRRAQAVAALVPNDLAYALVTPQLEDDLLAPAGGRCRVFVQEVPTSFKLKPVDLHCEAQQRHGLSTAPPHLLPTPAVSVEVLEGAEIRAWRAADHQERPLLPDLRTSSPPVLRLAKVPGSAVGICPQVKGGSSDQ